MVKRSIIITLAVAMLGTILAGAVFADPAPGDIFKEYLWANSFLRVGGSLSHFKDPNKTYGIPGIVDLTDAVKAEVSVQKLLCHDATRGLSIAINNKAWKKFPEAAKMPTPQWDYQYMTYPFVEVPLSELKSGPGNNFKMKVDPVGWWPQNLIYGVLLRVYYKPTKPHATGKVLSPASNSTVGPSQKFTCEATPAAGSTIQKVEYVGYYEDFNYRGDGEYTNWHAHYLKKDFVRHIGKSTSSPYAVTWNNSWVPDQPAPMKVAARITDSKNCVYFTEANSGLTLSRPGVSVKMYKPYDIPKQWVTRKGTKQEKFNVPASDNLAKATAAQLVWTSWCASYFAGLKINNKPALSRLKVAPSYDYGLHIESFNKSVLKSGANVLQVTGTPGNKHGMEVNWPGIVVFVKYQGEDMGRVTVSGAKATPSSVPDNAATPVTLAASAVSSKGTPITSMTVDLSQVGGSATQAMTKGTGNEWTLAYTVPKGQTPKIHSLGVTAKDQNHVQGTGSITLTVTKTGIAIREGANTAPGLASFVHVRQGAVQISLAREASFHVEILDASGRKINKITGFGQSALWNGQDSNGRAVRQGPYMLRIRSGEFESQHKIVLVR